MSQLKLRLARVGHLLWLMKFRNPQLIESERHRTAIMHELLLHMQHSTLSTLQFHILIYYCTLPNPEPTADDYPAIARQLEAQERLVVAPEKVRLQFNDAIRLLTNSPSLRDSLRHICLIPTLDMGGLREPGFINSEFEVPELDEGAAVDALGRKQLLRRMLGEPEFRCIEHKLGDATRVAKIDRLLAGVCGELTDDVRFVMSRLYGIGVVRLDEVGIMQEQVCPFEDVVRKRNYALAALGGQVRDTIAEVLGVQPVTAA